MKALYKYPQNEYPYSLLERENRERGIHRPEFELNDTGKISVFMYTHSYLPIYQSPENE